MVNDELVTTDYLYSQRKTNQSEITERMIEKAKATRKAYGRMERQEEEM